MVAGHPWTVSALLGAGVGYRGTRPMTTVALAAAVMPATIALGQANPLASDTPRGYTSITFFNGGLSWTATTATTHRPGT